MQPVQALPCTIGFIEGNPNLKTDNAMGVVVGDFELKYEAFDNSVASGKKSAYLFTKNESLVAIASGKNPK